MITTTKKRKYNSTRRQAQALQTRQSILDAARALFTELGYSGATIEAIANKAGVAPETIFAIFGNKRSILANLIESEINDQVGPTSPLGRSGRQPVLQEQAPFRILELFAADIYAVQTRVSPILEIMRTAAKTEPDINELLQNLLAARLKNLAIFVRHLASRTPLRADLDASQATETVWAITSAEVFNLLVLNRGWSRAQYIQWLSQCLARLLLP